MILDLCIHVINLNRNQPFNSIYRTLSLIKICTESLNTIRKKGLKVSGKKRLISFIADSFQDYLPLSVFFYEAAEN